MQTRLVSDISLTWQSAPGPGLPLHLYPDHRAVSMNPGPNAKLCITFLTRNGSDAGACCPEQARTLWVHQKQWRAF